LDLLTSVLVLGVKLTRRRSCFDSDSMPRVEHEVKKKKLAG
jgi:hypothetical protein